MNTKDTTKQVMGRKIDVRQYSKPLYFYIRDKVRQDRLQMLDPDGVGDASQRLNFYSGSNPSIYMHTYNREG